MWESITDPERMNQLGALVVPDIASNGLLLNDRGRIQTSGHDF
jgi:hypothetical protein